MAAAAPPVLASDIWLSSIDSSCINDSPESANILRKLSVGVKAIDTVLEGGFDYGAVHCITSEPEQGVSELVQALMISHLQSSSNAIVTLIDSTLSFDVRTLFQLLQDSLAETQDSKAEALKTLERVNIMKIFDYVGLTEAVAEVREGLESVSHNPDGAAPKSTIEDSEGEEEMLNSPLPSMSSPDKEGPDKSRRGLLVVDNFSKVMAPLIKNNYTSGQASLSTSMCSLNQLTRNHNFCTVLVSSASHKQASKGEGASLWESCTIRPLLGASLGFLVDVQIYIHSAQIAKLTERGRNSKAVERAEVFEVVQDGLGGRYGSWAPFLCTPDGKLLDVS